MHFEFYLNTCQPPLTEDERLNLLFFSFREDAMTWLSGLFEAEDPKLKNYELLKTEMMSLFDGSTSLSSTSQDVLDMYQFEDETVADFAFRFRFASSSVGHNDVTLSRLFERDLKQDLALALATLPRGELIETAVSLDKRRSESVSSHRSAIFRQRPSSVLSLPSPSSWTPRSQPRPSLTPDERARRVSLNLCMYCGSPDHLVAACTGRPREPPLVTKHTLAVASSSSPPSDLAILSWQGQSTSVPFKIDSGSDANFISRRLVQELRIDIQPLQVPFSATCANGSPLSCSLQTDSVNLLVSGNHRESIQFLVNEDSTFP